MILDPFDQSLDNANLVVVAPAGAGKSFTVKVLALRQLVNGVDCIVIDPEDEYRPIANAVDGQIVRLAASSGHQLNPFDLPTSSNVHAVYEDEDALAERVTALLGMLEVMLCSGAAPSASRGLDAHERAVLDRALSASGWSSSASSRVWKTTNGRSSATFVGPANKPALSDPSTSVLPCAPRH